MQHSHQVSLKNLITVPLSQDEKDCISESDSNQGSIIDLLRKQSKKSIGQTIGDLAEGRIRVSPNAVRSLKAMEEMREDDYFVENTHSELVIDNISMKKIQSEDLPGNQYFGKHILKTTDNLQ